MMEFLLSRVWMAMAGLVLTVVVMAAFNSMDDATMEQAALEKASTLADLIKEMEASGFPCQMQVDGGGLLFDSSTSLQLRNGSLWLERGGTWRAIELPTKVIYIEDRKIVEQMSVERGDVLKISSVLQENSNVAVQVEKVEATSSTASMNLLHSSTVLYR